MSWARLLLAAATTLASADPRARPRADQDACLSWASCGALAERVSPRHVVLPLCLPAALALFAHAPTLLLPSRHRVRRLWAAAAQLAVLWAGLLAVAAVYLRVSPSHAYALSLHLASLLAAECPPPHAALLSRPAHAAAKYAALAALVGGAWQLGPPLPVVDTPGFHGLCGASAHLLAWASAETLGRAGASLAGLLGAH